MKKANSLGVLLRRLRAVLVLSLDLAGTVFDIPPDPMPSVRRGPDGPRIDPKLVLGLLEGGMGHEVGLGLFLRERGLDGAVFQKLSQPGLG